MDLASILFHDPENYIVTKIQLPVPNTQYPTTNIVELIDKNFTVTRN